MTGNDFYTTLTPFYHLIYADWEESIARQAVMLDAIVGERWGSDMSTVLDVSCGIGTQSLGLAQLGYSVTASDLSPAEIERAKEEAAKRGLEIAFSVADMRQVFQHHGRQFDLVISCDNAVPHLLTDEDISAAFSQFYQCTRPGGGCLISVRDYENEDTDRQHVQFYGTREEEGVRYILFQVRDYRDAIYDLSMYIVEDRGDDCRTHVMRSQYYAVGIDTLMDLMEKAGFVDVTRIDDKFFQPAIAGTRQAI